MLDTGFPITATGGVPVVEVPAEVDITTSGQLRDVLLRACAGQPTLVVDMTHTLFCDSSGLHVLVRAHRRAMSEGGELRLAVPASGAVARILALTGLNSYIPCFPSVAEALAGTAAPGAGTGGDAGGAAMPESGAQS
jgi:anti-anti-sigma factor